MEGQADRRMDIQGENSIPISASKQGHNKQMVLLLSTGQYASMQTDVVFKHHNQ